MMKLKDSLALIGIFFVVGVVWQILELVTVGELQPSWADTIIGVIFTLSLYANLQRRKPIKFSVDLDNGIVKVDKPLGHGDTLEVSYSVEVKGDKVDHSVYRFEVNRTY